MQVDDQAVTLTGTVDSWQEKQLAAKVAKGVRGVKALNNRIHVDYKADRPDDEIEAEIAKRLRWDVYVDDGLIDVRVNDGKVTLSGTVGSAAEKREARRESWVSGVIDVNTDKLNVARWARDEDLRKDKFVDKSDEAIEEAVEDAMLYDPRVYMFEVGVVADDGVVTLSGTVDNLKAKRAAAQDARHTVGVWRVKNHIQVVPSTPSDTRIEQRIERALLRNSAVNRHEIGVEVLNNIVYLSGEVDTYFEKAEADEIAASAYGVIEVNNNIDVDAQYEPWTYDPHTDDYYIYDYDWYTYPDITTAKNDWEILEDIRDELWWSPFVDSEEVVVTVDDGVATLTGTVDTWSEREAATQNAYEGGAVGVDNDLNVDYGPDYYNDNGND